MTGLIEPLPAGPLPAGVGAVLVVDTGAIIANWNLLRARHPGGAVAGVVKANAYGLGATIVAPALHGAGCRHFFTAHLTEALAIRALVPGAMIAVLNGLSPDAASVFAAYDITPVLGSLSEIAAWGAAARQLGRKLPALLHIDTGMARLGLDAAELARLAGAPELLAGIDLRFVMTHLVASERPEDPLNALQRARFATACAMLPAAPRSLANSSGIFLGAEFISDLARAGAALYGINPMPGEKNPMRPVARLQARVIQVREIAAHAPVGYDATWRAARPSRIATVALGYADGWPFRLSGQGAAIFDGAPVPLVGRVSMDLTTYDVTDHPAIQAESWLEVIGPNLPPERIAEQAGTTPYEILTSLGARIVRLARAA